MTKFLVTYHGGPAPTPESMPAMMAAFEDWTTQHKAVIVDGGAPVMPAGQVATGDAGPLASIGGYSILEGSEAEVQAALQAHPFVARGGTLQLNVTLDPSQLAKQS
jgi:hypothetical protein